ncbi:alpha-l-rhamnosidase [Lactobacillus selangorensis]|uniref:alpha-L-rhamnosidase n=1 Tax=Lactobacillus selangorensis TaxID=81857 RepID=A0A0R2FR92_9LACO|nr:alpha-L-rhamnosidase [Lactobacillus selangorensis]KRN27572.1 alpha-l-rhamnosidase [Lactobacillus selangorensis]KRN30155.1 alpha-l-rhamnosidase [Lactobacillus selangorensis]
MKIKQITTNHMFEPLGFQLSGLRIEFQVDAESDTSISKQLKIWREKDADPVYVTKMIPFDNNYFEVPLQLQPRTRYTVEVTIRDDQQTATKQTFFETGKMNEPYSAEWIGNSDKEIQNTLFKKHFATKTPIKKARLYITGLGLYEAFLDQHKVGAEYLTPGVTDYKKWVQVQTYDVTDLLNDPAEHELVISTGDGWYKGRYGFDGGQKDIYGDQQQVIAELHIEDADGHEQVLNTDSSWLTTSGKITKSAIYYGEDYDATKMVANWKPVVLTDQSTAILRDRMSMPIKINQKLPAQELITTPKNEQVLDFGQNQAGWLEFYNREPKGTQITFQMGEILQKGNFYRDNLREARAAFVYISDGKEGWVHPHFTYYGYRYVKVTGNTLPINIADYKADVIYSSLEATGKLTTNNSMVNRLLENIVWGQKSNFIDVPTDCPQRDERLGWTGDANIFSNTAALNMNVYEFFKKYARDMSVEQKQHDGMLTMYAPAMGTTDGGAAVWGDAATTIPWNMYQAYGDPAILAQNYTSMKAWVDWISKQTKTKNLWTGTFQFGDWIALDGENPALPTGKTDEDFIASVYYYYSSQLVANAAKVLGNEADYSTYTHQAESIKQHIQHEYITATGRLAIDTQTAYALTLYFKLVPAQQLQRVAADLAARLHKDNDHLKTGFVGTPFICQALSQYGYHKLAVKIFLQEDYPSWLYAVKMGATTVWERWNSVEEDGSMNPDGMNSLNHYSIGAIMEWVYKYLWGLQSHSAGYQKISMAPYFDARLSTVKGTYETPYGNLTMDYQIESDAKHTIKINLTVPFGVTVDLSLPRVNVSTLTVNGTPADKEVLTLTAGTYAIAYQPTHDYIERYNADTHIVDIMANKDLVAAIDAIDPVLDFFKDNPDNLNGGLGKLSLTKINTILPMINITPEHLQQINQLLTETPRI